MWKWKVILALNRIFLKLNCLKYTDAEHDVGLAGRVGRDGLGREGKGGFCQTGPGADTRRLPRQGSGAGPEPDSPGGSIRARSRFPALPSPPAAGAVRSGRRAGAEAAAAPGGGGSGRVGGKRSSGRVLRPRLRGLCLRQRALREPQRVPRRQRPRGPAVMGRSYGERGCALDVTSGQCQSPQQFPSLTRSLRTSPLRPDCPCNKLF